MIEVKCPLYLNFPEIISAEKREKKRIICRISFSFMFFLKQYRYKLICITVKIVSVKMLCAVRCKKNITHNLSSDTKIPKTKIDIWLSYLNPFSKNEISVCPDIQIATTIKILILNTYLLMLNTYLLIFRSYKTFWH